MQKTHSNRSVDDPVMLSSLKRLLQQTIYLFLNSCSLFDLASQVAVKFRYSFSGRSFLVKQTENLGISGSQLAELVGYSFARQ